ncbi:hypothetical protein DVH05_024453 [Phytophthora capsici]|nr:hypothetical protein DVH05_024453 [Phytophthora capsici]
MGFTNHASGVMYWIVMSLFMLMQTYLGQLFIYAAKCRVAAIFGVLYNSVCRLFAGFNPPASSILRVIMTQHVLDHSSVQQNCVDNTLEVYENGGSE